MCVVRPCCLASSSDVLSRVRVRPRGCCVSRLCVMLPSFLPPGLGSGTPRTAPIGSDTPLDARTVLLQGCYQVLERRKKTYLKRFYQLWRAHKSSRRDSVSGRRQHRFDNRNARRCCGVGVRVSAPLRRGAAPYGDGSLCSQAPSHLIFLLILR